MTQTFRVGAKMNAAETTVLRNYGIDLRTYLRQETNRGRDDTALGREFGVNRHTISNWKRLLGIVTVKRAISSR